MSLNYCSHMVDFMSTNERKIFWVTECIVQGSHYVVFDEYYEYDYKAFSKYKACFKRDLSLFNHYQSIDIDVVMDCECKSYCTFEALLIQERVQKFDIDADGFRTEKSDQVVRRQIQEEKVVPQTVQYQNEDREMNSHLNNSMKHGPRRNVRSDSYNGQSGGMTTLQKSYSRSDKIKEDRKHKEVNFAVAKATRRDTTFEQEQRSFWIKCGFDSAFGSEMEKSDLKPFYMFYSKIGSILSPMYDIYRSQWLRKQYVFIDGTVRRLKFSEKMKDNTEHGCLHRSLGFLYLPPSSDLKQLSANMDRLIISRELLFIFELIEHSINCFNWRLELPLFMLLCEMKYLAFMSIYNMLVRVNMDRMNDWIINISSFMLMKDNINEIWKSVDFSKVNDRDEFTCRSETIVNFVNFGLLYNSVFNTFAVDIEVIKTILTLWMTGQHLENVGVLYEMLTYTSIDQNRAINVLNDQIAQLYNIKIDCRAPLKLASSGLLYTSGTVNEDGRIVGRRIGDYSKMKGLVEPLSKAYKQVSQTIVFDRDSAIIVDDWEVLDIEDKPKPLTTVTNVMKMNILKPVRKAAPNGRIVETRERVQVNTTPKDKIVIYKQCLRGISDVKVIGIINSIVRMDQSLCDLFIECIDDFKKWDSGTQIYQLFANVDGNKLSGKFKIMLQYAQESRTIRCCEGAFLKYVRKHKKDKVEEQLVRKEFESEVESSIGLDLIRIASSNNKNSDVIERLARLRKMEESKSIVDLISVHKRAMEIVRKTDAQSTRRFSSWADVDVDEFELTEEQCKEMDKEYGIVRTVGGSYGKDTSIQNEERE